MDPWLLVLGLMCKLALSTLTLKAADNDFFWVSQTCSFLALICFLFLCTLLSRWQIPTQPWSLISNFISLVKFFLSPQVELVTPIFPWLFIYNFKEMKKKPRNLIIVNTLHYHYIYFLISFLFWNGFLLTAKLQR